MARLTSSTASVGPKRLVTMHEVDAAGFLRRSLCADGVCVIHA